ncbi:HAD-IIA family hydrolase [Verrucomicrobiota bacterium]
MIKAILLDLDGTVYWGTKEVPGAGRFITNMRKKGIRCMFVTNRANRTRPRICQQLQEYGIPCEPEDIITSALATVQHLKKGSTYFIGEEGMKQAIEESQMTIDEESPNYVIVSYDRTVDYEKIKKACNLIHKGAKFIATNPDRGLKTQDGISPGTGSIVAAVSAGCGVEPLIIGKPEKLIIEMALEQLDVPRDDVILVGDNIETDVPAGQKAGLRTALLLGGISVLQDIDNAPFQPTWIVENYEELEQIIAAG